jgi:hypothetical protein
MTSPFILSLKKIGGNSGLLKIPLNPPLSKGDFVSPGASLAAGRDRGMGRRFGHLNFETLNLFRISDFEFKLMKITCLIHCW